nr:substrate-binding domain-containing protein [Candidatus Pantoea persica]
MGFQQNSELKAVEGITIVGLIPPAVQQDTLYGAVVTSSKQLQAAESFVRYLQSEQAKTTIRDKGLTPL